MCSGGSSLLYRDDYALRVLLRTSDAGDSAESMKCDETEEGTFEFGEVGEPAERRAKGAGQHRELRGRVVVS